jgi:hypothetical protein
VTPRRGARPPSGPAAGERAIAALEALLGAQREAMLAADVAALAELHPRIHALICDAGWRRDAARVRSPLRVRTALKTAAINAGLAARGEAQAARALAALGAAPGLYTATGALGGRDLRGRGVSV